MNVLTAENVTIEYNSIPAVKDLSFAVNKGDCLCILGENGGGKSTTVKGILGLVRPTKGRFVFGEGLSKKSIGYLPQRTQAQLDFPANVEEIVLSGTLAHHKFFSFYNKKDREKTEKYISLMHIEEIRKKSFSELSGGQQQRVLLARALASSDGMLLLDEPVTGLDPVITAELYSLIRYLNRECGITVITVSHDPATAAAYATHILHIEKEVLYFGPAADYGDSEIGKKFVCGCGKSLLHKH